MNGDQKKEIESVPENKKRIIFDESGNNVLKREVENNVELKNPDPNPEKISNTNLNTRDDHWPSNEKDLYVKKLKIDEGSIKIRKSHHKTKKEQENERRNKTRSLYQHKIPSQNFEVKNFINIEKKAEPNLSLARQQIELKSNSQENEESVINKKLPQHGDIVFGVKDSVSLKMNPLPNKKQEEIVKKLYRIKESLIKRINTYLVMNNDLKCINNRKYFIEKGGVLEPATLQDIDDHINENVKGFENEITKIDDQINDILNLTLDSSSKTAQGGI